MSIQKYTTALAFCLATLFISTISKAQVVMVTKSVKEANVKVFVTSYESEADVLVFKTPFINNANGNAGSWYFTKNQGEANKRIYFVPGKEIADIVICYTTDSKLAGWKNKRKKHFMD